MTWLTALGMCVAGLAGIIVEFFVPAAGIIGLAGFGSIVGGVVIAYNTYGTLIGSAFLIGMSIITPAVVIYYFKRFPKSAVGKWLILKDGSGDVDEKSSDSGSIEEAPAVPPYVRFEGETGVTITSLRPAGTAMIDGEKVTVYTGGEFIEKGESVVVTHVAGNRIVVRKGATT